MKRILILVFAIFWLLSRGAAAAETAQANLSETTGVGIGGLIGALVGGPPGALIGAAGGAWLGQRHAKRDAKIVELEARLRRRTTELSAIKAEFNRVHAGQPAAPPTAVTDAIETTPGTLHDGLSMPLFFRTGSAEIEPRLRPHLERLGTLLKALPELRVHLSGHADRRGSETDNLMLSARRLRTVRSALERCGVDTRRIHTRALGEFGASGKIGDVDAMAFDRTVIIQLQLDTEA